MPNSPTIPFEDLGDDAMPSPGFREPPRTATSPDKAPGVDWTLAAWRILLVGMIVTALLVYHVCNFLNFLHVWLVRRRSTVEKIIAQREGTEPQEVV